MVFLGSEKQTAARALCLQQLMKRKPAISLQQSQHLGREQSYLHPQHGEQQLGTGRGSGAARGEQKGPGHQPAEMAAATSPAVRSLLAAAGGEGDMLQLRLIK